MLANNLLRSSYPVFIDRTGGNEASRTGRVWLLIEEGKILVVVQGARRFLTPVYEEITTS